MPAAGRGGKATPLRHQEAIGGDTECGVMMEAAPAAAFEVAQAEFLRLTTPKLHPKEHRPLFGDPGTEKRLGPFRSGSLFTPWDTE